MQGRAALITGAGRGIGRAIAATLAQRGCRVAIVEIDEAAANEAASALGSAALAVPADVGEPADVREAVQRAQQAFGRLDIVVNNTGIGRGKPPDRLTVEEWDRVLAVNLRSALLTVQAAEPMLRAAPGGGRVVNIASTRALMSEPHTEAYSASKAGLIGLTHALAISLGPDVRVNCISPGWINTRQDPAQLTDRDHAQHAVGRVGRPEDIAALAAFLCSDEAGFITGQNFIADGGKTRQMIYA